jgi:hypothetical protein
MMNFYHIFPIITVSKNLGPRKAFPSQKPGEVFGISNKEGDWINLM